MPFRPFSFRPLVFLARVVRHREVLRRAVHLALFVFRLGLHLELRRTAARQADRMMSRELRLAQGHALHACPVRARSSCHRVAAVPDLGWRCHAHVLCVCLKAALPRRVLGLHRVARTAVESSLISPYRACHALFQAECVRCLVKGRQRVILMAYRSYPGERRASQAVCLFQMEKATHLEKLPPLVTVRPRELFRAPAVRDVCLFQVASLLCLVKSPDLLQRLVLSHLAKPRLSPALSQRRLLAAERSLGSRL
jgi:hypothetical protein